MPRPKKLGVEPKRRSRFGCHNCKRRKVKCGEEKPTCNNCIKSGEACDYSIILNWEGRSKRKPEAGGQSSMQSTSQYHTSTLQLTPSAGFATTSPFRIENTTSRPISSSSGPGDADTVSDAHSTADHETPFIGSGFSFGTFGQFRLSANPYDVSQKQKGKRRRLDEDASAWTASTPESAVSTFSPPSHQTGRKRKSSVIDVDQFAIYYPETPGDGCPASTPATPGTTFATFDSDYLHDDQARRESMADYGFDTGRDDIDLPDNDDASALSMDLTLGLHTPNFRRKSSSSESETDPAFGFGLETTRETLQRSGYYSRPVTVSIPKEFQPLPPLLQRNPMNLLYFHHFLNHTARCLVPHDCAENAFRTILPQMAVGDENLMNLLLAYSANHRARLLKHDVPRQRIAQYVEQVFPRLRQALSNSEPITNSTLATAIMLASLEIVSPNAFEIPISWSKHLSLAREMIVARGGYLALRHGNKVSYFLSRWFAYLDVLGSLSGGTYDRPLTDNGRGLQRPPRTTTFDFDGDAEHNVEDIDNDDEIDCFLGFTGRCITVLSDVANLAKDCDQKRRHLEATTGNTKKWSPGEDDKARAFPLEQYLLQIKSTTYRGCSHRQVKSNSADTAVNEAFHHAGLIHLYRRVLGYPPEHERVQAATRAVRACLRHVEDRSISCMIFPVFSAGCEATNPEDRASFLACLKKVGKMGMAQARRSRDIMERVWETNRAWQELVQGEFMG